MEPSTEDTDWMEFLSKSGQLMFYYNKVTAEHRWPDISNGYENGTPIYGRPLVCVGTQTNDYGCSNRCGSVHVDGGVIQSINVEEGDPLAECSNLNEDVSPASQESSDAVFDCGNEFQVMAEVTEDCSQLCSEGDTTHSDVFGGSGFIQSNNVKEECISTESWQLAQLAENVLLASGPSENTVFDSGSEMEVKAEVTEDCRVGDTTHSDVFGGSGFIQSNNVKEGTELAENELPSSGPSENMVTKYGLYKCKTCGRTFTDKKNLKQHEHVHSTKSYECDTCGREFKHRRSLRYHEYTHTGGKPQECKTCGKRFIRREDLKRHEYTHTGTKPYECQTCGKRFIQQGHLKYHERTHTGTKPHECKTCGKRFIQLGSLKCHERTHADTKPYECKTCGKTFTVKQYLKRHEYTHGGS